MSEPDPKPNPKVFISYSWTTDEHRDRVRDLADRLLGDQIEVLLDQYDLREGDDKFAYMERSVTDPTVTTVLAIIDRAYAKKMDGREGGVGTEGTIMSPEVYKKIEGGGRSKFVAVLFEIDEEKQPHLPAMFAGKIYIDMSTEALHEANFEQLVRFIYDRPLRKKPALGQRPSFLLEDERPSLITAGKVAALRSAVEKDRHTAARGYLADYLEALEAFLAAMPLAVHNVNQGNTELALGEIDRFIPYRNEYVQLLQHLSRHADMGTIELLANVVSFFERVGGLPERLGQAAGYSADAFGHVSYAAHTLFIYTAGVLWKARRLNELLGLLNHAYFIDNGRLGLRYVTYADFSDHLKLLETNRGDREGGSKQGALMEKHASGGVLTWVEVCETDALLWMRSMLNNTPPAWYPRTVGQWDRASAFPAFARAESKSNLAPLAALLNVAELEIKPRLEKLSETAHSFLGSRPYWFELSDLVNLQRLGTKP